MTRLRDPDGYDADERPGEPFPIDPLSAASWQRIERAVFNQLDSTAAVMPQVLDARKPERSWRFRPLYAGFAAAGAVALAAALLLLVIGRDGKDSDRAVAAVTATPSRVVTAEAATRITVGRALIEIAPHSVLWVSSSADQGTLVVLEQGRVDCAVAHADAHQLAQADAPDRADEQAHHRDDHMADQDSDAAQGVPSFENPPFVVQAGDARIEVVGTRFAVSRAGSSARVEVSRGIVQVFHDGERTLVRAGETWPASRPDADETADTETAALDRRTQDSKPAGKSHRKSGRASPLSAKDRYETAAKLESSDPRAAIAIYRELAREGGIWAANALYARARLEHDRGSIKTARRLLRQYLSRYRTGANAADARALLDQISSRTR